MKWSENVVNMIYADLHVFIRHSTWRHAQTNATALRHSMFERRANDRQLTCYIPQMLINNLCAFYFRFVCSFRCFVWIFDVRSLKWYSIRHPYAFHFSFFRSSCLSQLHSYVRSSVWMLYYVSLFTVLDRITWNFRQVKRRRRKKVNREKKHFYICLRKSFRCCRLARSVA